MVKRWFLEFQGFDIIWDYIKGPENEVADSLSRLCENQQLTTPHEVVAAQMENDRVPTDKWQLLRQCHNSEVGHHGLTRMLQKLDRLPNGNWPNRRQHAAKYIRQCPCCQKMSRLQFPTHASAFTLSTYSPMSRIAIDAIQDLIPDEKGNNTIIVIIDTFSRFIELYPTDGVQSSAFARALLAHIGRYGIPNEVISDRGSAFTSAMWEDMVKTIGIEHILTTAYSKEENGIVERANKEVMRHLRNIVFDKNVLPKWSMYLPLVQRICNSSIHWSTGVTPASIVFGNAIDLDRTFLNGIRNTNPGGDTTRSNTNLQDSMPDPYEDTARNIGEWMSKMLAEQARIIDIARKHLNEKDEIHLRTKKSTDKTEFPIDSYVLLEYANPYRKGPPSKLLPYLQGPLRVVNHTNDIYTIQNLVTLKCQDVHVTRLRPFTFDPTTQNPIQFALRDSSDMQEVQKITDIKGKPNGRKTGLLFLVHWIGFAEPTWEPWKTVRQTEALRDFLTTHENADVQRLVKDLTTNN
jgi:hypothetical protein